MAGTLSVGVVGITRPANTPIHVENQTNPLPPEGFEYLMVNVSVECLPAAADQCDPSHTLLFVVIDRQGAQYEQADSSLQIPAAFPSSPEGDGQIAQGNLAFLVPIGAEELVLYAVWPNMTGVYLGLY